MSLNSYLTVTRHTVISIISENSLFVCFSLLNNSMSKNEAFEYFFMGDLNAYSLHSQKCSNDSLIWNSAVQQINLSRIQSIFALKFIHFTYRKIFQILSQKLFTPTSYLILRSLTIWFPT